ncbi:PREDICTED: F-box/kelch-repeat protein SKIP6-like [Tarenaya hassleriana]|uniref:F-box/kelch-repeat protein SKIP6-like n=1 Tax=Tarenaya hassleriana TaxID=28532 RepID=UPI00053C735A|nr:PREDICTED: F-box/kelch-repeat protein SKIP6-like [Tarenaya hassleriana]
MSSPVAEAEEPPPLIPPFPDDVAVNCIARVPRCFHPSLALVSKGITSLLTSTDLYAARSILGCAESVLCICLGFMDDPETHWYTLTRKPFRTKPPSTTTTEDPFVLVKSFVSPPRVQFGTVSVGSEIYFIGGSNGGVPTSSVSIFDFVSRTYREAPNMLMPRSIATGLFVDGKIYVAGGCKVDDWERWAEVFDLKTQTWEFVPSPSAELRQKWTTQMRSMRYKNPEFREKNVRDIALVDGKIYFLGNRNSVAYEPKEGRWEMVDDEMHIWCKGTSAVVDNVLYRFGLSGRLLWYNAMKKVWKNVKGVEELPEGFERVLMMSHGGKLGVFWENDWECSRRHDGYKEVWYGEIVLEGLNKDHDMIGRFHWSKSVLTVLNDYYILESATATL